MTTTDDFAIDEGLYRLLLIGYLHRQEVYTADSAVPAFPVLGALWQSDCYPELVRRKLSTRSGLRNKVQLGSHIVRKPAGSSASQRVMAELAKAPDAAGFDFVMLVRPGKRENLQSPLDYTRILGAAGYPLYLTDSGQEAAREAMVQYEDMSRQAFLTGKGRFESLRRHEKEVL